MSTRKALAFSFLDRYSGLVLAILSSMVIARLLTPAEIGLFAVTSVLLSFISALRDMGAGQYLVQEKELTPDRIRATWTVQLGLGLAFSLVVLAAAYPAAAFYGEPRMTGLMMVLSLNFAISPFGSLTYAWLMREMRFDLLALMRFSGSLASSLIAVGLAWKGYGPLSLALSSLAGTLVNAAVAVWLRPPHFPWLPGTRDIRRVLSFGGRISAANLVELAGEGVPELLLGKLQGVAATGLYSRSMGLASMFRKMVMQPAMTVAIPHFSKENRNRGDVPGAFLRVVSYATVTGWPFLAGMIIFAQPLTRLLYGPQWDETVEVTRLLCAGMMLSLPGFVCGAVLHACGEARRLMRTMALTVMLELPALALGAAFGLHAVGLAFVASRLVGSLCWLASVRPVVEFRAGRLLQVLGTSGLVATTTALAALSVAEGLRYTPATEGARFVLGAVAALLGFAVGLSLTRHPFLGEIRDTLQRIRWRKALGTSA